MKPTVKLAPARRASAPSARVPSQSPPRKRGTRPHFPGRRSSDPRQGFKQWTDCLHPKQLKPTKPNSGKRTLVVLLLHMISLICTYVEQLCQPPPAPYPGHPLQWSWVRQEHGSDKKPPRRVLLQVGCDGLGRSFAGLHWLRAALGLVQAGFDHT